MTAIINFLKSITDGVLAVLEFLFSIIQDTAYMATLLGKFVLEVPQYLSFIPAPVLALITTIFTIVVIYKILGREG